MALTKSYELNMQSKFYKTYRRFIELRKSYSPIRTTIEISQENLWAWNLIYGDLHVHLHN